MRIAALGDIHVREKDDEARVRALLRAAARDADVLVLCGDLTDHGRPAETEILVKSLHEVDVPVVCVLGNHDHEGGSEKDIYRMLASGGVHCLDRKRPTVVLDGVGFAGVKGFGGGFGNRLVRGFGEESLKAFVSASVVEAEALRTGLRSLDTDRKVAVLHYAPIVETIVGEPLEIQPFLGTTRLEQALDEGGAHVAFHGHAHKGSLRGKTSAGIPVYNVSLHVLHACGHPEPRLLVEM